MPVGHGSFDAAFRFGQMQARRELAAAAVGQHIREKGQHFLRVKMLEIEGAEARRIDDVRVAVEAHDFRMARRVAAALDLFADGADREVFTAENLREEARLAHARRAGKGRHAMRQELLDGVEAVAALGRDEIDVVAAAFVESLVLLCRRPVEVALIEAQCRMDAAVFAGHEHLVDEELVRVRRLRRHDDEELVDVGHGRAADLIAPGQEGFDDALILSELRDVQFVADEDLRLQQFAAAAAFHEVLLADIDVIIAVVVFDDASFCQGSSFSRYTDPVLTNC